VIGAKAGRRDAVKTAVTRRVLIAGLLLATLAGSAWAQQTPKVPIVGVLRTSAGPRDRITEAMLKGLRELGYTENVNIRIEIRTAEGEAARLPRLADELVGLKVDVIVAATEPAIRAAQTATSSIPIVMAAYTFDPVASRLIDSVGHPKGNLTGVTARAPELAAKRLELLKEAIPHLTRVAVLWDALSRNQIDELKPAASSLGIRLELDEVRAPYDFKSAIRTARKKKAGAVMVLTSVASYGQRKSIAEQALESRLPVTSYAHELTRAGRFISYGPELEDAFYRTAYFIDKLLKGARPSDLPLEQSENLKLVVNLKTAKLLGIAVPESVLVRADEVIR
jgi:putative ABC transport system substrate-binding protein